MFVLQKSFRPWRLMLMKGLSIEERFSLIIIMGLIAFGTTLYYQLHMSETNPTPLILLGVFTILPLLIAARVIATESRNSAKILLLGVLAVVALPSVAIFGYNFTSIGAAAILALGGVSLIVQGYAMKRLPKRIPVADYARGEKYSLCPNCEQRDCPGCGKKEWV